MEHTIKDSYRKWNVRAMSIQQQRRYILSAALLQIRIDF
jgi:hypothetical protein